MADSQVGLSVSGLLDAIRDHRKVVESAGLVRVDARDAPAAECKHEADVQLWSLLDEAEAKLLAETRVLVQDPDSNVVRFVSGVIRSCDDA